VLRDLAVPGSVVHAGRAELVEKMERALLHKLWKLSGCVEDTREVK
jgi:hypothetical protein